MHVTEASALWLCQAQHAHEPAQIVPHAPGLSVSSDATCMVNTAHKAVAVTALECTALHPACLPVHLTLTPHQICVSFTHTLTHTRTCSLEETGLVLWLPSRL